MDALEKTYLEVIRSVKVYDVIVAGFLVVMVVNINQGFFLGSSMHRFLYWNFFEFGIPEFFLRKSLGLAFVS